MYILEKNRGWEDERKNATDTDVELYLVDAFEIFHFEPFYIELRKKNIDVVFVAEPWETNTSGKWFDYDAAVTILEEKKYVYHKSVNINCKCAITTQHKDILKKYTNAKKIQLVYGMGFLKKVQFQLNDFLKDPFDYYFVNGGYYKDKFLKSGGSNNNIIDVSYPKHINFFRKGYRKQELIQELEIHTEKPILLYYPTWDEYSSIRDFADKIGELRNDFFVVTKPHHCTYRLKSKRDDLNKLYQISDLVLDGNYDFAKTTVLADLAICDSKSASSTEIPFLNPNIKMVMILVNTQKEDYDYPLDNIYCVIDEPNDLKENVRSVMINDKWKNNRNEIIKYAYSSDVEEGLNRGLRIILNSIK